MQLLSVSIKFKFSKVDNNFQYVLMAILITQYFDFLKKPYRLFELKSSGS